MRLGKCSLVVSLLTLPAFAQSASVSSEDLLLLVKARVVGIGQGVTFRIENQSNKSVFVNPDGWSVYRGSKVIRKPLGTETGMLLAAWSTKEWTWGQKNDQGNQVSPGLYRVEFTGSSAGPLSDEFVIAPNSSAPILFKTTKAKYAVGEEVKFYLLNKSANATMANYAPWAIRDAVGPVYIPAVPEIAGIFPVKSHLWTWDQVDQGGDEVDAGKYNVRLTIKVDGKSKSYTRFFKIAN